MTKTTAHRSKEEQAKDQDALERLIPEILSTWDKRLPSTITPYELKWDADYKRPVLTFDSNIDVLFVINELNKHRIPHMVDTGMLLPGTKTWFRFSKWRIVL